MQPIPAQILKDSIIIKTTTEVDRWNKPTTETQTQSRVHIQGANEILKNKENTEVQLKAILFVDKRLSTPFIDWSELQRQAESAGHTITVEHGKTIYTVLQVNDVPDPFGLLHHYEVGLI